MLYVIAFTATMVHVESVDIARQSLAFMACKQFLQVI